jgi:hypothetical protein
VPQVVEDDGIVLVAQVSELGTLEGLVELATDLAVVERPSRHWWEHAIAGAREMFAPARDARSGRERTLPGLPTVRVNGVDVDPTAAERSDFGLKCRIYRSTERASPLPPEHWIRTTLT